MGSDDANVHSPNESQHAERGGQNQSVRLTLPVSGREMIVAIICAIAILTSLTLWSKLDHAERDLQTQVWVKQDKAEARYLEFISGPYAELAAQSRDNARELEKLRAQVEKHK